MPVYRTGREMLIGLARQRLAGCWMLAVLVYLAGGALGGYAQEDATTEPAQNTAPASAVETKPDALSLSDCVAIALGEQVDILIGEQALASAKANEIRQKSAYYPQLSVQSSRMLIEHSAQDRDRTSHQVALSHLFWDNGLREASVKSAKYGLQAADAELLRTRQATIYQVTTSYFALLRAQQLAQVAEAQVRYTEGQLLLVEGRIQAGDAAPVDALPLRAQLANARVSDLSARNDVLLAATDLQQAMGLTPEATFAIQEVPRPALMESPLFEPALAEALGKRPDLAAAQASVGAAEQSVKTAKIQKGAQLNVTGDYYNPLSGSNDDNYDVTAVVVYDLFDGKANKAAYEQAKASLSQANLRAQQVTKDITAELRSALLDLSNSQERVKASALSVAAAQANLDAQDARYAQGLGIPLDLVNAQLELTTARSNAVEADYDYLTALARVHYVLGREGLVSWD